MKFVVMNAPDYFKEHKHLIKMLLASHKKEFVKEARAQIKEVKAQKEKLEKKEKKEKN